MGLLRNASFNFLGAAAPAVLSVVTIPYIVAKLGAADFGLLALITSIVGYFALLDINVTAGSTKYVAEYQAAGNVRKVNETICFGLAIYSVIGLFGMLGLYYFADGLTSHVFAIPADRQPVATAALSVAALGFFTGQLQAYLQSLPGALMRYDVAGKTEAGFGTAVPLITVALLATGHGLIDLVWLRVAMSTAQACLLAYLLRGLLPAFGWAWPGTDIRRALLSFSAYAFLSRLAALTYSHADKLLISARVGVAALTFYVVPSTLANRVMSLVSRFSGVMFPHASALAARHRLQELERDYLAASRYMFFVNGAIALTLATLAQPILSLWLNAEFASAGTAVMVMVALAQWVDSLTNLPSLVNDGLGQPRVTGLFALTRALLGLALIFLGVWQFGIRGAAAAHLLAALLMSTAFVVHVHGRSVPVALRALMRQAYLVPLAILAPVAVVGGLLAPWAATGWFALIGSTALMAGLFATGGLRWVLLPLHRQALWQRVQRLRS